MATWLWQPGRMTSSTRQSMGPRRVRVCAVADAWTCKLQGNVASLVPLCTHLDVDATVRLQARDQCGRRPGALAIARRGDGGRAIHTARRNAPGRDAGGF